MIRWIGLDLMTQKASDNHKQTEIMNKVQREHTMKTQMVDEGLCSM